VSVILFSGGPGAPGATTAMLALALVWPNEPPLVVEADADGGVLAARFGLGAEPGVLTLSALARRGANATVVVEHTQTVLTRLRVLCCPPGAEQAVAALETVVPSLAGWAAGLEADVLVDAGRLSSGVCTRALVGIADLTVLVARPSLDQTQLLVSRLTTLARVDAHVGVLLVGDRPYRLGEVAGVVETTAPGTPVLGLPDDRRAAEILRGCHRASEWQLRRTALLRDATSTAATLAQFASREVEHPVVDGHAQEWLA
jgi:hypothetical protein